MYVIETKNGLVLRVVNDNEESRLCGAPRAVGCNVIAALAIQAPGSRPDTATLTCVPCARRAGWLWVQKPDSCVCTHGRVECLLCNWWHIHTNTCGGPS